MSDDTRACVECLRLAEDVERQAWLTQKWMVEAERLRVERDEFWKERDALQGVVVAMAGAASDEHA